MTRISQRTTISEATGDFGVAANPFHLPQRILSPPAADKRVFTTRFGLFYTRHECRYLFAISGRHTASIYDSNRFLKNATHKENAKSRKSSCFPQMQNALLFHSSMHSRSISRSVAHIKKTILVRWGLRLLILNRFHSDLNSWCDVSKLRSLPVSIFLHHAGARSSKM